jgi:hypothetical protein
LSLRSLLLSLVDAYQSFVVTSKPALNGLNVGGVF